MLQCEIQAYLICFLFPDDHDFAKQPIKNQICTKKSKEHLEVQRSSLATFLHLYCDLAPKNTVSNERTKAETTTDQSVTTLVRPTVAIKKKTLSQCRAARAGPEKGFIQKQIHIFCFKGRAYANQACRPQTVQCKGAA